MAYEPKPNTGSLFVNDRKETDNHPDRQGTALIDGKEYYVNGWIKQGSKGQWLSMSFKPKEARGSRQESRPRKDDFDADGPPF